MNNDFFFLSIFQGIAEFLPISSNGHLVILEKLFNIKSGGFETHVALHFGSLFALFIYFFKDIFLMIFSLLGKNSKHINNNKQYRDLLFTLIIASFPAMLVGFLIKKFFGTTSESFKIIAIASIVFGILLILADTNPVKDRFINYKRGILIGICQCLAFIPGASRSGVCITAARFFGMSRIEATRFSFLMAIPTILGASTLVLFEASDVKSLFTVSQIIMMGITAGFGILTIQILLWFVNKFGFFHFGIYRILFGLFILFFL